MPPLLVVMQQWPRFLVDNSVFVLLAEEQEGAGLCSYIPDAVVRKAIGSANVAVSFLGWVLFHCVL